MNSEGILSRDWPLHGAPFDPHFVAMFCHECENNEKVLSV